MCEREKACESVCVCICVGVGEREREREELEKNASIIFADIYFISANGFFDRPMVFQLFGQIPHFEVFANNVQCLKLSVLEFVCWFERPV